MKPHRGIDMASIASAGLEGLPGVIIVTLFAWAAIGGFLSFPIWVLFEVLGLPVPSIGKSWTLREWPIVLFLITEATACIAYTISQRRDARRTAELEEEFHSLNEPGAQIPARPTSPRERGGAIVPRRVEPVLSAFQTDELRRLPGSGGDAPEAILGVVIWLILLWGLGTMVLPVAEQRTFLRVVLAVAVGVLVGSLWSGRRARRQAKRLAWASGGAGGSGSVGDSNDSM